MSCNGHVITIFFEMECTWDLGLVLAMVKIATSGNLLEVKATIGHMAFNINK